MSLGAAAFASPRGNQIIGRPPSPLDEPAPPDGMRGAVGLAPDPRGGADIGGVLERMRRLRDDMDDIGVSHYIGETEKCLGAGAAGAAISMCWNATMSILYRKIVEYDLMDFNAFAVRSKIRPEGHVSSAHDLNKCAGQDTIRLCGEIGLCERSVADILQTHRMARNSVAQVSLLQPSLQEAANFADGIEKCARLVWGVALRADRQLIDRLMSLDSGKARAEIRAMLPPLVVSCVQGAGEDISAEAAGSPPIKARLAIVKSCIESCRNDSDRAKILRALFEGLYAAPAERGS